MVLFEFPFHSSRHLHLSPSHTHTHTYTYIRTLSHTHTRTFHLSRLPEHVLNCLQTFLIAFDMEVKTSIKVIGGYRVRLSNKTQATEAKQDMRPLMRDYRKLNTYDVSILVVG